MSGGVKSISETDYRQCEEKHRPELRIVGRADGVPQSSDALPINRFAECRALDYHLKFSYVEDGELPHMFILAPYDIVLAKPRNVSDADSVRIYVCTHISSNCFFRFRIQGGRSYKMGFATPRFRESSRHR